MNAKQIAQKTADFFRTVPVEKAWLFGSFSLLYISHLIGVLENLL